MTPVGVANTVKLLAITYFQPLFKNTETNTSTWHYFHPYLPVPWPIEFTKKDPLPCAKGQPALMDQDHLRASCQGSLDMCCGIPLEVPVTIIPGDKFLQHSPKVLSDIRIGCLVDRYSGSCMRNENIAYPLVYSRLTNFFIYKTCNINQ